MGVSRLFHELAVGDVLLMHGSVSGAVVTAASRDHVSITWTTETGVEISTSIEPWNPEHKWTLIDGRL
jgi:hypothetical protein